MPPIVRDFDTGAGRNFKRVDMLEQSYVDNTRHSDVAEVRSASDTKLIVSGTIILYLRMVELRTSGTSRGVDKLAVHSLLAATFIDKRIK